VVDALTRIHAALVPGGVLVDTQPVGSRWPVGLAGHALGELETDEWVETVAVMDTEIDRTFASGLFELRHQERYAVVHEFGSGRECLDEVETWAGTRIPAGVAERLARGSARATVEHEVRLRLFLRR
jgi:hypothetical protein